MLIYYDDRQDTIQFGVDELKEVLDKKGIYYLEKALKSFVPQDKYMALVITFNQERPKESQSRPKGGFSIELRGNLIYLTGDDPRGAMAGLFDLAETIDLFGVEGIKEKVETPFMEVRGVKFNLPFEPYDMGDPIEKNIETCLDLSFWKAYIDFLAKHRYNCLSLWSEHPFHMMFRLEKYPETCPYSDVELARYQSLYTFIFSYAQKRGIDVYLITWNIRITTFVAKGLGLPEAMGDMTDRYNVFYDGASRIPNNIHEFDKLRQHSAIVKDYLKECIKTLAMTYRDLKGIGTNCAEEMTGSVEERHQWGREVYLEALKETGRDMDFIIRTNSSNGGIAKEYFIDAYPGNNKYISFKYSNAHMYSHPRPKFEDLWNTWDGIDMENINVLYTVRNDDYHTFRAGDPAYITEYIKGMKKPYVRGFYWGADGYIWGRDFQHVPHKHRCTKTYEFEKHWYQFALLGRLGFNPDISEDIWMAMFTKRYGEQWGKDVFFMMKAAGQIIPSVNRLFWINYDFQWHPESLLTVYGFKTILDFMNRTAMPGIGTIDIRTFVDNSLKDVAAEGETPEDIIRSINTSVNNIRTILDKLKKEIPSEYQDSELGCTLLDMEAWMELGTYYSCKFQAALDLVFYEHTGKEETKQLAIEQLEKALLAWERLSVVWSSHYMPYKMVRSKHIFGYTYYIDDVKRDISIARNITYKPI